LSNETKKSSKSEKSPEQGVPGNSNSLQGWPGYRTRKGRTGYDPLDEGAESGHMLGVIIHRLFTGKLYTKNPFTLVLMAVLSILGISPILLAILEIFQGNLMPIGVWVVITIAFIIGIAILINLIKNLLHTLH
jgi:hypothetical protein